MESLDAVPAAWKGGEGGRGGDGVMLPYPMTLQPPGLQAESWVGVGSRSFRRDWAGVKCGSRGVQGDAEDSLQGSGLAGCLWVCVRSSKMNDNGLWTKKSLSIPGQAKKQHAVSLARPDTKTH